MDLAIARGENPAVIRSARSYLATAFQKRLRQVSIESHEDQLALTRAARKARIVSEADASASEMKLAALGSSIELNAKGQQKLLDARIAKAAPRAEKRERRSNGIIVADDGSKTFDADADVMEVHRTKVSGRYANAIMLSFDGATVYDVVDALHRVVDRDKPRGKGSSSFFDPMSIEKIVSLAKAHLKAIVLHRRSGLPASFLEDGPAAFETDYVAVSRSWVENVMARLPELAQKSTHDLFAVLDIPNDVLSEARARLTVSLSEAIFRIAAHSALAHLDEYGPKLNGRVQADMERLLTRANGEWRDKRERAGPDADVAARGQLAAQPSFQPSKSWKPEPDLGPSKRVWTAAFKNMEL